MKRRGLVHDVVANDRGMVCEALCDLDPDADVVILQVGVLTLVVEEVVEAGHRENPEEGGGKGA